MARWSGLRPDLERWWLLPSLQVAAPTLVNVLVAVALFTYMGCCGLLAGRGALWALAWPLVLLLNAPLHETSHIVAGRLQGLGVLGFHAWGLSGNYVRFTGDVTWPILAAPYLRDLASFALSALLLGHLSPRRRALWLGILLGGMLLPLWNTGLEYASLFAGRSPDLRGLLAMLGPAVHLCFIAALAGYLAVTVRTLRRAASRL